MASPFRFGTDVLLEERREWLTGRRIGLIAHPAAVASDGRPTAVHLRANRTWRLSALFGPEHGWHGRAGAGERCASGRHAKWNLPVHSLYGKTRKPTRAMVRGLDTLVFDVQDLGVRCYTYVSTLRLAMEAAAEYGLRFIVADRPVPLGAACDGPRPDPAFASFVAAVDTPFVYGLTPGETARWLRDALGLDLDLRVAPMRGYARESRVGKPGMRWIAPSPAIRSLAAAQAYPVTVCFEAFGGADHARRTRFPFQAVAAPWLRARDTAEALTDARLPGIRFQPCAYAPAGGRSPRWPGVRLRVTDPVALRPALAAVTLTSVLARRHGKDRLWAPAQGGRPEFFDRLFGTDAVRLALLDGDSPARIAARWKKDLQSFRIARRMHALYKQKEQV